MCELSLVSLSQGLQNVVIGILPPKNPNLKVPNCFNTLASGWFWRFSQKNSSFRLSYQCPSSSADCARELFNGSNELASLVDWTRKKFFAWGVRFFCE